MSKETLESLRLQRARVAAELRAVQARAEALGVELGHLDFRILYWSGVPRTERSNWRNPILTEKPKPDRKKAIPVPDFDLLD